ncbi:MAG: LysR family transcriptional regulator [Acidimicrobiales bacterium]|nr:LysR family transcriptional regulator [Acidimicrobiales bacterium]
MDLRQLAALVAVADCGTFSAAAKTLHTVQSNVSTHVAHLERELGVVLVDRTGGRLTPEGEAVVRRARRIQHELDALAADVASVGTEVAGSARLGVIGTTARWLVPPLLGAVRAAHPRVHPVVLEASTTSLVPQLLSGQLDLAVVNLPLDDPDLAVEALFDEDLLVVAPLGHALAERPEVTMAELAEHPLLLGPPGTAFRDDLDVEAARAGVRLQAQAEIDGVRLIASLAFSGFGAAVLPATAVPVVVDGPWRPVGLAGVPYRHVGLARRRRGLPSTPARAVRDVLRKVVASRAGDQPGVHLVEPVDEEHHGGEHSPGTPQ